MRASLKEAVRYWETRRVTYNAILTAVAIVWVLSTWPHFRGAATFEHLLALGFLALLANICYSAAYLAEFSLPELSATWTQRRWGLWLAGTLFAILIENYWIADEIYPDVR